MFKAAAASATNMTGLVQRSRGFNLRKASLRALRRTCGLRRMRVATRGRRKRHNGREPGERQELSDADIANSKEIAFAS